MKYALCKTYIDIRNIRALLFLLLNSNVDKIHIHNTTKYTQNTAFYVHNKNYGRVNSGPPVPCVSAIRSGHDQLNLQNVEINRVSAKAQ